jgi:hypothetical protein
VEVKPNLTLSVRRKFSYLNTQESTPRPGLPQGEVAPSVQLLSSSFLRKQESIYFNRFWTPAFAGVTDLGLFIRSPTYRQFFAEVDVLSV